MSIPVARRLQRHLVIRAQPVSPLPQRLPGDADAAFVADQGVERLVEAWAAGD